MVEYLKSYVSSFQDFWLTPWTRTTDVGFAQANVGMLVTLLGVSAASFWGSLLVQCLAVGVFFAVPLFGVFKDKE
jgi:uncharacterized membrane protein